MVNNPDTPRCIGDGAFIAEPSIDPNGIQCWRHRLTIVVASSPCQPVLAFWAASPVVESAYEGLFRGNVGKPDDLDACLAW
jgi:hypothetical protein